ncbi:DNA primase [Thraustotheca clavata]|uniref:DNA primase n=1 Tax=Thraustotheca clavata TaxID=74557 RepID=A0A1V9ZHB6_9STRA|nr:DNA primase [Thraustotheca clavata]
MSDLMYAAAPSEMITLDKLEALTMARLDLLLHVNEYNSDQLEEMDSIYGFYGLRLIIAAIERWETMNSGIAEWWIDQEIIVFQHRLYTRIFTSTETLTTRLLFVKSLLMDFGVEYELKNDVYLVPFQHVPMLVRQREVVLYHGMCHIPPLSSAMITLLMFHYRRQLERQFQTQISAVEFLELSRFNSLQKQVLVMYKESFSQLNNQQPLKRRTTAKELDEVQMPLCMKSLYDHLKRDKHLKYDGRNQLRLFLKGLGFTFDENYAFWKTTFCAITPAIVFEKKYAYNIRHNYGLVGSRKDYAPMNCSAIQNRSAPRPGQYHGCPYKHWEHQQLIVQLQKHVGVDLATAIANTAKESLYGVACGMHLEAVMKGSQTKKMCLVNKVTISHPNFWFDYANQVHNDEAI